jgi:predicted O-methyltransferase YrrM
MEFTADWHSSRIPLWEEHLCEFVGKPVRFLEIGSHEGRSAVWLLQNVLTHAESTLTCIDPWPQDTAERRFDANIAETGQGDQLLKIKSTSFSALKELKPPFDFIYVDGSHEARHVIEGAVLSFRLLRSGGILIFDDYWWRAKGAIRQPPKPAIDCFLELWSDCLELLHKRGQVVVRKACEPDETFLVPARRTRRRRRPQPIGPDASSCDDDRSTTFSTNDMPLAE